MIIRKITLIGLLLVSTVFSKQIFEKSKVAKQFLNKNENQPLTIINFQNNNYNNNNNHRRHRRSNNGWFEETRAGDFERECLEEVCTQEEARESSSEGVRMFFDVYDTCRTHLNTKNGCEAVNTHTCRNLKNGHICECKKGWLPPFCRRRDPNYVSEEILKDHMASDVSDEDLENRELPSLDISEDLIEQYNIYEQNKDITLVNTDQNAEKTGDGWYKTEDYYNMQYDDPNDHAEGEEGPARYKTEDYSSLNVYDRGSVDYVEDSSRDFENDDDENSSDDNGQLIEVSNDNDLYYDHCDFGYYGANCQYIKLKTYQDIEKAVRDYINSHHLVIFSRKPDPTRQSRKGKKTMRAIIKFFRNTKYSDRVPDLKIVEVNHLPGKTDYQMPDLYELENYFSDETGDYNMPKCYIGGKFVGGGNKVWDTYHLAVDKRNSRYQEGYEFVMSFMIPENVQNRREKQNEVAKPPAPAADSKPEEAPAKDVVAPENATQDNDQNVEGTSINTSSPTTVQTNSTNIGPNNNEQPTQQPETLIFHPDCPFGQYNPDCSYNNLNTQAGIQKSVDDWISTHHTVIFSKDYCKYSKRGKKYLSHIIKYLQKQPAYANRVPDLKILEINLIQQDLDFIATLPKEYDDEGEEIKPEKRIMEGIQEYMGEITGDTTVPRIFIKGKFVGGSDTVVELYKGINAEDKTTEGYRASVAFFKSFVQ